LSQDADRLCIGGENVGIMSKSNIMSVVLGLVVGLVIGFVMANSLNRSVLPVASAPALPANSMQNGNPALPPDHPALGTSNGGAMQGNPVPQVAQAIDKAKNEPQNFEAQMTAADLYYQIQRYDEAAQFYEAASKIKPNEIEPMIKAGNANFDGDKYEAAEKWYLQALAKDPKNINVRTDLGLTFFLRTPRDIDRAVKEYRQSLAIDPEHEITLQNLALAYDEMGDKENLKTTLDKLKKVNPSNPAIARIEGKLQ